VNYQQQAPQPKRGMGAGAILAIVFGGLAIVVLGAFAFCVGAVKNAGAKAEKAAASAQVAAAAEGAAFVPLLAKLVTDPKSLPPKTTKPGKDGTVYTYDDPKGTPLHALEMTVQKPGVWAIEFTTAPAISAQAFAPGATDEAESDDDAKVYSLGSGPLKDAVVAQDGPQKWRLMSASFAMTALVGGEKTNQWLCDRGRVPGVQPMDRSEFAVKCKDMVRAKLVSPSGADFGGGRVITNNECGRTLISTVEAPNALGVKLRKNFVCTHTPKTGLVEVTLK